MPDTPVPRIYTKTGDAGETGLFDGTRVSKADPRVDACGEVDELTAALGLARCHLLVERDLLGVIDRSQRTLLAIGARLADPHHRVSARVDKTALTPEHVAAIEQDIDRFEAELPPLRHFLLAGGSEAGATLHLARSICRRAERRVVGLGTEAVDSLVVVYLNRLSDLLFVMARVANARAGVPEIEW